MAETGQCHGNSIAGETSASSYPSPMHESELHRHIERLSAGMAGAFPRVLIGPGDDCAMVAGSDRLLLTVDQLVEGRHFVAGTSVDLIARKAVARSISDLAAMACRPVCGLATGLLPPHYAHARELTDRLHHWANHWRCPLVGGDLATGPAGAPLVLTVTAMGELGAGERAVTRGGASAGDSVYVTGRLGNSLASGRHLSFVPRVEDALWLRATLGDDLHAMIDLSDGLGRDAARIARASGVRIEIDAGLLPLHADTPGWQHAMGDGEDYELCFVSGREIAGGTATPGGATLTRIGSVVACGGDSPACMVRTPTGSLIDASVMGWEHG